MVESLFKAFLKYDIEFTTSVNNLLIFKIAPCNGLKYKKYRILVFIVNFWRYDKEINERTGSRKTSVTKFLVEKYQN